MKYVLFSPLCRQDTERLNNRIDGFHERPPCIHALCPMTLLSLPIVDTRLVLWVVWPIGERGSEKESGLTTWRMKDVQESWGLPSQRTAQPTPKQTHPAESRPTLMIRRQPRGLLLHAGQNSAIISVWAISQRTSPPRSQDTLVTCQITSRSIASNYPLWIHQNICNCTA